MASPQPTSCELHRCNRCGNDFIPSQYDRRRHRMQCSRCRYRKMEVLSVLEARQHYRDKYAAKIQANPQRNRYSGRKTARDGLKEKARKQTRLAVNKGIIQKLPCVVCSSTKVEAHHQDYTKPLEVIWLCKKHHADEHNKIRAQEYKSNHPEL